MLDSFGHLQQPEQGSASPASDDPGHSMLEGMLSTKITSETGGKTERITDWTDSDGHEHHKVYEDYKDGSVIVTDIDKTTGVVTVDQHTEEGSGASLVKHDTTTTYDPNTGQTKVERRAATMPRCICRRI